MADCYMETYINVAFLPGNFLPENRFMFDATALHLSTARLMKERSLHERSVLESWLNMARHSH